MDWGKNLTASFKDKKAIRDEGSAANHAEHQCGHGVVGVDTSCPAWSLQGCSSVCEGGVAVDLFSQGACCLFTKRKVDEK